MADNTDVVCQKLEELIDYIVLHCGDEGEGWESQSKSINLELGVEWVFDCDAVSDDAANGKFTSWTSAKTIRALHRSYGSGYYHTLHNNVWWDGTGASGARQAPIKPMLLIQAIA